MLLKTSLGESEASIPKESNEDCPKISRAEVTKMIAGKVDTKDLPPSLAVTKGVNKFGQMVFKDLEKSTNLVFSPFSLSTALAMLTPGAKGNTFKQVLYLCTWGYLAIHSESQLKVKLL